VIHSELRQFVYMADTGKSNKNKKKTDHIPEEIENTLENKLEHNNKNRHHSRQSHIMP